MSVEPPLPARQRLTYDTRVLLIPALVLLLALNAFFVLAEFAIVKVRPTRVAELIGAGDGRAIVVAQVQKQLDIYLGVCQVGITLASVALGIISEQAAEGVLGVSEHSLLRSAAAIALSYVLVSGSHIVLGEQVPKSVAIRIADRAALLCARPLKLFRILFWPALWLLTRVAQAIVRVLGLHGATDEERHSRAELRLILDHSQERGLMSFRRLLFMENVFDIGELTVRDAMRPRSLVRTLEAQKPWADNLALVRSFRFTRYPLIADDPERPIGFIHLKDVAMSADGSSLDLKALARRLLSTPETTPLEQLLAEMQRRRIHMALVTSEGGRWTGLITLEDIVEELVGTIRDEFEDEAPVRLGDLLRAERIHLDLEAGTVIDAVQAGLDRTNPDALPLPKGDILRAVALRESQVGTYLGEGIVMPHARMSGLAQPFVMLVRSKTGVQCEGTAEKGHLLFVLVTPAGQPRIHQQLQSIIATLLHESRYVPQRLLTATSSTAVLEVLRTGEQAVLD